MISSGLVRFHLFMNVVFKIAIKPWEELICNNLRYVIIEYLNYILNTFKWSPPPCIER
jgi:hypothetical protein